MTVLVFVGIMALKAEQILIGYQTAAFFTTKTTHDVNDPLDLAQLGYTFAIN